MEKAVHRRRLQRHGNTMNSCSLLAKDNSSLLLLFGHNGGQRYCCAAAHRQNLLAYAYTCVCWMTPVCAHTHNFTDYIATCADVTAQKLLSFPVYCQHTMSHTQLAWTQTHLLSGETQHGAHTDKPTSFFERRSMGAAKRVQLRPPWWPQAGVHLQMLPPGWQLVAVSMLPPSHS
jgi:hypothetical protein